MELAVLVLLSATVAGYHDFRRHRVPNWLTGLTVVVSLAWHGWAGGTAGLWSSAKGLCLAVSLLLPLYLLRGMGAGDVKYFGALGSALAPGHVLPLLTLSLAVGGTMALWRVARQRVARETARNIADMAGRLLRGRVGAHPVVHIDNPQAQVVPFTFAQAVATWILVASRWGAFA